MPLNRFAEATSGVLDIAPFTFGAAPDVGQLLAAQQSFQERVLGGPIGIQGTFQPPEDVIGRFQSDLERREQLVDTLIMQHRGDLTPLEKVLIRDKRGRRRLTIAEINQLSDGDIREGMDPVDAYDERTPVMRFLDLIDLPRNTVMNAAVGDVTAEGILGGLGVSAGLGATFGAIGTLVGGPAAWVGAAVLGGAFLLASSAGGVVKALQDEPFLEDTLSGLRVGAAGQPSIFTSDLLERLGMENRVARAVIGFAGDVMIDPLSYFGGAGNVVRITGRTAKNLPLHLHLNKNLSKMMDRAITTFEKTGQLPRGPLRDIISPLLAMDKVGGRFIDPKTLKVGDDMVDVGRGHNRAFKIAEAIAAERGAYIRGEISLRQLRNLAAKRISTERVRPIGLREALKLEIGYYATHSPIGRNLLKSTERKVKAAQDALRWATPRSSVQVSIPMIPFIANRFPTLFGGWSGSIPLGSFGQPGRIRKALMGSHEELKVALRQSVAETGKSAEAQLLKMMGGVGKRPVQDLVQLTDLARQTVRPLGHEEMGQVGTKLKQAPTDRQLLFDDDFVDSGFRSGLDPEEAANFDGFADDYQRWASGETPGDGRYHHADIDVVDPETGRSLGQASVKAIDAPRLDEDGIPRIAQTVMIEGMPELDDAHRLAFLRQLQAMFPNAERFGIRVGEQPRWMSKEALRAHTGPPPMDHSPDPTVWMQYPTPPRQVAPDLPLGMGHLRKWFEADWATGAPGGHRVPLAALSSGERDALLSAGWTPTGAGGVQAIDTKDADRLMRQVDRWKKRDTAMELERVRQERAIVKLEKVMIEGGEVGGKQITGEAEKIVNLDELPLYTEEGMGALHQQGGLGPLQRRMSELDEIDMGLDRIERELSDPDLFDELIATDNLFGAHLRGEILDNRSGLARLARTMLLGPTGHGKQIEELESQAISRFYRKQSVLRPLELALHHQVERVRHIDPAGLGIGTGEDVGERIKMLAGTMDMQGQDIGEWIAGVNHGLLEAAEGSGRAMSMPMPHLPPGFARMDDVMPFERRNGEVIFAQFPKTPEGVYARMLYEAKPYGRDVGEMAKARALYAMEWVERATGISRRKIITARKRLLQQLENEVGRGRIPSQDIKKPIQKLLDDIGLHGPARLEKKMDLWQALTRVIHRAQQGNLPLLLRDPEKKGNFVINPKLLSPSKPDRVITLEDGTTEVIRGQSQLAVDEARVLGALAETSGAAVGGKGVNDRIFKVGYVEWAAKRAKEHHVIPRARKAEMPLFPDEPDLVNATKEFIKRWAAREEIGIRQLQELEIRQGRAVAAADNALQLEQEIIATKRVFDDELDGLVTKLEGPMDPVTGRRKGGLRDKAPYRVFNWIATKQEKFAQITRVGRKGTRPVEPVQALRAESENNLLFYRRTIFHLMDTELRRVSKALGGNIEDQAIHAAVTARMLDRYAKTAQETLQDVSVPKELRQLDYSVGPFEDDEIWEIIKELRKDETTASLLESPEIERTADAIIRAYTQFHVEQVSRGLMVVDQNPVRMYLPLQFEDAARESMNLRLEELGETMSRVRGRPGRASITQKFMLERSTNRMQLPIIDEATRAIAKNADGSPKLVRIYTGQLKPGKYGKGSVHDVIMGDATHDFERSRQTLLRAVIHGNEELLSNAEKVLKERPELFSGDLYDMLGPGAQGAQAHGPRWMPRQHMSSPYHLNKNRDAFIRMVGEHYVGPIFRTNPLLAFANRIDQQFASVNTDSFVRTMMPQLKVLTNDEFRVYPPAPGQAGARMVDGVPMRALDETKIRDSRVRHPLPDLAPEGSTTLWPAEVATEYENLAQVLKEEAQLVELTRAIDTVNTVWKVAVLSLPRWLVINVIGSMMLAKMAGANWSTMFTNKGLWKATAAAHGVWPITRKNFDLMTLLDDTIEVAGGEIALHDLVEEAIIDRVINSGRVIQEVLPAIAVGSKHGQRLTKYLLGDHMVGRTIGKWFKYNAAGEDFIRLSTYVDLRNQGFSRSEAAAKVAKYLYDYGDLSLAEKRFGTRLWPFYRWMRNNAGLQVKQALEKPKYMAAFPKVIQGLRESFEDENSLPMTLRPRWIRDQMALDVWNNRDNAIFLNLNSLTPAQEIFEMGQSMMGAEGFSHFMKYFIGAWNPLLKNAVELAAGREMFTRFEIGDPKEGAAITIPEYLARQTGVLYELFHKIPKAGKFSSFWMGREDDEPVAAGDIGASAARFIIGGRLQARDIEKLVRTKRFEEGDRSQQLRFAIKRAVKNGDVEEAHRLALEFVERMRTLWDVGMVDMVPKPLRARFRIEDQEKRRQKGRQRGHVPLQF